MSSGIGEGGGGVIGFGIGGSREAPKPEDVDPNFSSLDQASQKRICTKTRKEGVPALNDNPQNAPVFRQYLTTEDNPKENHPRICYSCNANTTTGEIVKRRIVSDDPTTVGFGYMENSYTLTVKGEVIRGDLQTMLQVLEKETLKAVGLVSLGMDSKGGSGAAGAGGGGGEGSVAEAREQAQAQAKFQEDLRKKAMGPSVPGRSGSIGASAALEGPPGGPPLSQAPTTFRKDTKGPPVGSGGGGGEGGGGGGEGSVGITTDVNGSGRSEPIIAPGGPGWEKPSAASILSKELKEAPSAGSGSGISFPMSESDWHCLKRITAGDGREFILVVEPEGQPKGQPKRSFRNVLQGERVGTMAIRHNSDSLDTFEMGYRSKESQEGDSGVKKVIFKYDPLKKCFDVYNTKNELLAKVAANLEDCVEWFEGFKEGRHEG